jgi:hypothetical protein
LPFEGAVTWYDTELGDDWPLALVAFGRLAVMVFALTEVVDEDV